MNPGGPGAGTPGMADIFDAADLDFWLGRWDVSWPDGGHGTNELTRILGDRVVAEHFRGASPRGTLEGRSWSVFDEARRIWRQTWVDDSGSYIELVGERVDGWFAFGREAPELGPRARQRMVFRDVQRDALRWTWEARLDDGADWEVRWEIVYRRAGGAG